MAAALPLAAATSTAWFLRPGIPAPAVLILEWLGRLAALGVVGVLGYTAVGVTRGRPIAVWLIVQALLLLAMVLGGLVIPIAAGARVSWAVPTVIAGLIGSGSAAALAARILSR
jgi:hypothetical protein